MSAGGVRSSKKKSGFTAFFGLLLELCIVAGGILWVAYGYLPHQYYLPISFASICVIGVAAYFVLDRKVNF